MGFRPIARRWLRHVAALLLLLALTTPRASRAEGVAVPIAIQAKLLVKVAAYDRNLRARAHDKVRVLVLSPKGNIDSSRTAGTFRRHMSDIPHIAGLPHEESTATFSNGATLARKCREERIAIVYLTQGFSDEDIAGIVNALSGTSVLTAGADAGFVPKRIVLGFDTVSGKPKLLFHLSQARAQHVDVSTPVLRLMRLYR
jgi:hypothetical protein